MNVNKLCALAQGWTVKWNYRLASRYPARLTSQPKVPFWVDSNKVERSRIVFYRPDSNSIQFVRLLAWSNIDTPKDISNADKFRRACCAIIARRHLAEESQRQVDHHS